MFLDRNLYPNSMLINVKILIPPSTGIQGGGQQGGAAPPPGRVGPTGPGPGCPWKKRTSNC